MRWKFVIYHWYLYCHDLIVIVILIPVHNGKTNLYKLHIQKQKSDLRIFKHIKTKN